MRHSKACSWITIAALLAGLRITEVPAGARVFSTYHGRYRCGGTWTDFTITREDDGKHFGVFGPGARRERLERVGDRGYAFESREPLALPGAPPSRSTLTLTPTQSKEISARDPNHIMTGTIAFPGCDVYVFTETPNERTAADVIARAVEAITLKERVAKAGDTRPAGVAARRDDLSSARTRARELAARPSSGSVAAAHQYDPMAMARSKDPLAVAIYVIWRSRFNLRETSDHRDELTQSEQRLAHVYHVFGRERFLRVAIEVADTEKTAPGPRDYFGDQPIAVADALRLGCDHPSPKISYCFPFLLGTGTGLGDSSFRPIVWDDGTRTLREGVTPFTIAAAGKLTAGGRILTFLNETHYCLGQGDSLAIDVLADDDRYDMNDVQALLDRAGARIEKDCPRIEMALVTGYVKNQRTWSRGWVSKSTRWSIGAPGQAAAVPPGEVAKNRETIAQLTPKATAGSPVASYMLGALHQFGVAPPELTAAARWYQEAVRLGSPEAMYALARLYESGLGGVGVHDDNAIDLYRRASASGYAPAMLEEARQIQIHAPRAADEVFELYSKAAAAGLVEGTTALGDYYADNVLWQQSRVRGTMRGAEATAKAFDYYRQAADRGSCDALLKMGDLYYRGRDATPSTLDEAAKAFAAASQCPGISARQQTIALARLEDARTWRPRPAQQPRESEYDPKVQSRRFGEAFTAVFAAFVVVGVLNSTGPQRYIEPTEPLVNYQDWITKQPSPWRTTQSCVQSRRGILVTNGPIGIASAPGVSRGVVTMCY